MVEKRINIELNKLYPQKAYDLKIPFTLVKLNDNSYKLGVINNKTNNIDLIINVPKDYPFKTPSILINGHINFNKWASDILTNKPNHNIYLAWVFSIIKRPHMAYIWHNKIPNNKTCLCCESLTCPNNWAPNKMFYDIIVEYITRKDILINCSKLMQRYLAPIFNNEDWSLSEDLILYILTFVAPKSIMI